MTKAAIANYDLKTAGVKHVLVAGSFLPNGSSAVATTYGVGFTVARTGTGVFRVTLTRPFKGFVSVIAGITIDDTNAHELPIKSETVPTATANGYFDITHLTSSDVSTINLAAADITASGALRRINFIAVLAESKVPGAGV
jgi:hypothetical protein